MFKIELPASSVEETLEVGKILMKNGYTVKARRIKNMNDPKAKQVNTLICIEDKEGTVNE